MAYYSQFDPEYEKTERLAIQIIVALVVVSLVGYYVVRPLWDYLPGHGGNPCRAENFDPVACDNYHDARYYGEP